jgi:hypothetical protein
MRFTYGRLNCGVIALSGRMMVCAACVIAVSVNAQKMNSLNLLRSHSAVVFQQMI